MAALCRRVSFLVSENVGFLNILRNSHESSEVWAAAETNLQKHDDTANPTTVRDYLFQKSRKYRETKIEHPSKLLMVWRIKPLKGRPYWEKDVMKKLRLDTETLQYAIVKNTPSQAEMLSKVKHLVRIKPITFPNGFPKDGDLDGTFLKPTGEFIVSPKLKVDEQRLIDDPERKKIKMDKETQERQLRRLWHI